MLRLTLCKLMKETVGFLLCERGRKVNSNGRWGKLRYWRLLADFDGRLQVPQCVMTVIRLDMVLYSECERFVYFTK